jgi:hypothetical protein
MNRTAGAYPNLNKLPVRQRFEVQVLRAPDPQAIAL